MVGVVLVVFIIDGVIMLVESVFESVSCHACVQAFTTLSTKPPLWKGPAYHYCSCTQIQLRSDPVIVLWYSLLQVWNTAAVGYFCTVPVHYFGQNIVGETGGMFVYDFQEFFSNIVCTFFREWRVEWDINPFWIFLSSANYFFFLRKIMSV